MRNLNNVKCRYSAHCTMQSARFRGFIKVREEAYMAGGEEYLTFSHCTGTSCKSYTVQVIQVIHCTSYILYKLYNLHSKANTTITGLKYTIFTIVDLTLLFSKLWWSHGPQVWHLYGTDHRYNHCCAHCSVLATVNIVQLRNTLYIVSTYIYCIQLLLYRAIMI